ncbi:MAG: hypothetical protein GC155_14980 [Alphaproteobacteria bacterium]|nr:hypothetical protein [Alphaproteobacteria bacterium]
MSLLPASTNSDYLGARSAAWFLALIGALTFVPGCIHTFLSDGGAGVIAGLDLTANGPQVIGLFAWAGATQIAWGAMMLAVALRYRPLTPLALALLLVERTLHALDGWLLKAPAIGHKPPEAYAVLVALPLILIFLALSLRRRRAS